MPKRDVTLIYICKCGNYRHREDSQYCTRCGERLDRNRKNALADEIESLLVRWEKETNGIKSIRLAQFPR